MGEEEERERELRGEERQEAMRGIMSKLDELSKAVTAYHGITPPSLDLSPSPRPRRSGTRTRSHTLSHGTPPHANGTFSDTALSDLDMGFG